MYHGRISKLFFYFYIVSLILTSLAGSVEASEKKEGIVPFGGLNWTDNILTTMDTLNKMGFANVRLISEDNTIASEGIPFTNASDVIQKLNNLLAEGDTPKLDGTFIYIGRLFVKANQLLINGYPFNVTVVFVASPGYYLNDPKLTYKMSKADGSSQGIFSYAMEDVVLSAAESNLDASGLYDSIINLLDKKYKRFRPSDAEIEKNVMEYYKSHNPYHVKYTKNGLHDRIQEAIRNDKEYVDKFKTTIRVDTDESKQTSRKYRIPKITYNSYESFIKYLSDKYDKYLVNKEKNALQNTKDFKNSL